MTEFYDIRHNEDGTCTVSFFDAETEGGDIQEYTMPVVWFAGLEENIREHYRAWMAHARAYCAKREAFERALVLLRRNGEDEKCSK